MPNPRDVAAYPPIFTEIAAILKDETKFVLGPMHDGAANKLRLTWYAYVRAHQHTIERIEKQIDSLRLSKQNVAAKERATYLQNELAMNAARAERYARIRLFEVHLQTGDNIGQSFVCFTFKDLRYPEDIRAQVRARFEQLPVHKQQSEEDAFTFMTSPTPQASVPTADIALRSDPATAFLFGMSLEQKIAQGIATQDDFSFSTMDSNALRALVLQVPDNDTRNRMLGYLPAPMGVTVHVVPPDSPFASNAPEPQAQLDSSAAVGQTPPESRQSTGDNAIDLDDFINH